MPDNWVIKQHIDLANSQTSPVRWADTLFVNGDKEAHTWEVHVARNGAPVDLTGAFVTCYIVRPRMDSALVVKGTVSGNVLSATFPKEAYFFEGNILASLKYTDKQGATVTAAMLYAAVKRGIPSEVIDPGGEIVSIEEMLAMLYAMERHVNAIENMQVTATTLKAGAPATAKASYTGDTLQVDFGIPQGIQGETGTIQITKTVAGDAETPASFVEDTGSTAQNRKYVATIPAGKKGDTGVPSTLAVGKVDTGAPGSNAIVKNVGTTTNAILDITIPEGNQPHNSNTDQRDRQP